MERFLAVRLDSLSSSGPHAIGSWGKPQRNVEGQTSRIARATKVKYPVRGTQVIPKRDSPFRSSLRPACASRFPRLQAPSNGRSRRACAGSFGFYVSMARSLALEGTLQRLDGTNKLLWLVVPRFNQTDESQFGPYAYRSNGAQYLNLVWPVCLGFGWSSAKLPSERRTARRGWGRGYMILLPSAVLMASAPMISTSRGEALIALAALPIASARSFFCRATRGGP